jgi:hypothetical protein
VEFTQHDYEDRKGREGTRRFSDEDARLVALYEGHGFRVAAGGPINDPNSPVVVDPDAAEGDGNDIGSGGDGAGDGPASRYADLSYPDLQAEARKRGLPAGGGQAAIVARLEAADVEASKPDEGADTTE